MAFKMNGSAMYGKGNQANYGAAPKNYDTSKGSHEHPHAEAGALKEHVKGHVTKDGKTIGVTSVEGRDNEKGQSQSDVIDSRNKNTTTYADKVRNFKEKKGGLSEEQSKKANKKGKMLEALTTSSMDSIQGVNIKLDAEDAKKKNLSDEEFNSL